MDNDNHSVTPTAIDEYIQECASEHFTQEERDAVVELSTVQTFKKGHILIKEGQNVKQCFHVLKGCLRQYKIIDGEDRSIAFYTEDDSILSTTSEQSGYISKSNVECMEDCTLSMMTSDNERIMYKKFPKIESISRISLEQIIKDSQERFADFMVSTPEERYLNLVEKRPTLLLRIPQYHLASFLGIKPESLSRIRKRLAKKES